MKTDSRCAKLAYAAKHIGKRPVQSKSGDDMAEEISTADVYETDEMLHAISLKVGMIVTDWPGVKRVNNWGATTTMKKRYALCVAEWDDSKFWKLGFVACGQDGSHREDPFVYGMSCWGNRPFYFAGFVPGTVELPFSYRDGLGYIITGVSENGERL